MAVMANHLKVAVVGTGSIGFRHLQVLRSLGVSVVAVSGRSSRRLELKTQGLHCVGSIAEAKSEGANAAVIATDTRRHVGDTEEALNLGLHVLLEKPMGTSVLEVRRLPGLAAERGLRLFIGCPLRFDPGLWHIKRTIENIGAIHAVRIECRSYLPDWRPDRDYRTTYSARANEGGVLRDLIHEIDYAIWLFGVPRQVYGELRNLSRLGIEMEEAAEGQWAIPSGGCITIGLDYLSRFPHRQLTVHGERGTLEYDFVGRKLTVQILGSACEEMIFKNSKNDIYVAQMIEFLEIAAGGAPRLIASGDDGVKALAVCDAWRRSAVTQRIEPVSI
jgi:predicted dehydrogenase